MDNIFNNLKNTIGGAINGASNFIDNEVKQFSPQVQNFEHQAQNELGKLPGQIGNAIFQTGNQIVNPMATPQATFKMFQQGQQAINQIPIAKSFEKGFTGTPGEGATSNDTFQSAGDFLANGTPAGEAFGMLGQGAHMLPLAMGAIGDFGKIAEGGNNITRSIAGMQQSQDLLTKVPDLVSPQGAQSLFNKVRQAAENQPAFHNILDSVAQLTQSRAFSNLKDPLSAVQKILEHRNAGEAQYGINDVNDFLRGTVVAKDENQVANTVANLKAQLDQNGFKVVNESDYFSKPTKGYEGYHLDVQSPDGQIAEVQVHTPQSLANAQFTHNIYQGTENELPQAASAQFKNIQKDIKATDPVNADIATRAQQAKGESEGKLISPMNSDYTGNAEAGLASKKVLLSGQEPITALDAEIPVTNKSEILKTQAEQSPELSRLLQAKDSLAGQLKIPTSNPEIDGLVQMRAGLQQEVESSKAFLKTYDLQSGSAKISGQKLAKPPDIQAHIDDLQHSIDNIDNQVKDMGAKFKERADTTAENVKAQLKTINQQIENESNRVKIKQATEEKTGTTGNIGQQYDQAGLRDRYSYVNGQLTRPTDATYGLDEFNPRYSGNIGANRTIAEDTLAKQIKLDLPDAGSRNRVLEALSDPKVEATLNPKETEVLGQMRAILKTDAGLRANLDPEFKAIEKGYAPNDVVSTDGVKDPVTKQYLSTFSPGNQHRNLWSFEPIDGGEAKIGSPTTLKLKQAGNTFEDAEGKQYIMNPMTRAQGKSIGLKYDDDLASAMQSHINSTLNMKTNADLREGIKSGKYGNLVSMDKTPGFIDGGTIDPGFRGLFIDPKFAKAIQDTNRGGQNPGIVSKLYKGASDLVRDSLLTNFIRHPGNQEANGLIGAANLGPQGTADYIKNQGWAYDAVKNKTPEYIEAQRQGLGMGGFKDNGNKGLFQTATDAIFKDSTLSKIAGGADALNPLRRFSQANHQIVGLSDDVVRMSLYKSAVDNGKTPQEAAQLVRNFLVDYSDIGRFQNETANTFDRILNKTGIFYPYFKGETKAIVNMVRNPGANKGAIVMTAALIATQVAADKAFQAYTGNQDASLPHFGIPSLTTEFIQSPGQAMQGQIPTPISAHVAPILGEVLNQATNTSYLPDILNPQKAPIVKPGDKNPLLSRISHAAGVLGPEKNLMAGIGGTKSPGEIGAKFILGTNTPHLAGFQAAPSGNLNFLNTPDAKPGTGMGIIKGITDSQKVLGPQDQAQVATIKQLQANYSPDNAKIINDMYAANPKLWQSKAIAEKASAQANGTPVNPLYATDSNTAQAYYKYQNMTSAQKAAYDSKDQGIIQLDRQIDQYKQNPKVQAQDQQAAIAGGYQYKPYITNPLYANDPKTNQPKYSNQDLAAYHTYQQMPSANLTDNAAKSAYLGNHPNIMLAQIDTQNYQLQRLQQAWDTRPAGQNQQQFAAAQNSSLFGGIDANGKVTPAYNLLDEPKYKLMSVNPQAGALYQIYKAAMSNRNYNIADSLAGKYSWIKTIDAAQKDYNLSHPFNSESNNQLGGLGINFSGTSTGGSSSGGSSSSGSGSSLGSEMRYMLYQMAPSFSPAKTVSLKNPLGVKANPAPTSPLKGYFAQQQQLSKLLASMPQISTKGLSKLNLPKIDTKGNLIKITPSVPPGTQGRVEAGRVTRIGAIT